MSMEMSRAECHGHVPTEGETMNDRRAMGEEKVGEPLWELRHAANILAHVEFEHVRMDAIDHYIETFLMKFFPEVVDDALSDQQLADLDPDIVKQVAYLLVGDAIVQLRERLVSADTLESDPNWHEQLLQRIAKLTGLDDGPFIDHVLSDPQPEVESDPLLTQLSSKLGVEVAKFLVVQPAMIEVVIEDVLESDAGKR